MVIVGGDSRITYIYVCERSVYPRSVERWEKSSFNSISASEFAPFQHGNGLTINSLVLKGCCWIGYIGVIQRTVKNQFLVLVS